MKKFLTIILLLIYFFSFSQEKEDKFINNGKDTLKVYLTDAETDKNIADSKVTLEGFEIPEIKGKYHKKRKFYYFTEVPQGYNTIMTYHKKYNEKGFQDMKGLPKELKLKLKNKNNNFFILPDSFYTEDIIKFKKEHNYKDYYIEDPFKIVIDIDANMNYTEQRQYFLDLIKNNDLGIEMVNPFFEKDKMKFNKDYNIFNNFVSQKEGYPSEISCDINSQPWQPIPSTTSTTLIDCTIPLFSSYDILDLYFVLNKRCEEIKNEICFIFRKKDGTKFKRFNDPIIEKIKKFNAHVHTIIIYKNDENYQIKTTIRDQINEKFNIKYVIDSSKVFFYDKEIRNKTKYRIKKENKKKSKINPYIYEPGENSLEPYLPFTSINTNATFCYKNYNYKKYLQNFSKRKKYEQNWDYNQYDEKFTIPNQEHSIGLGLLDQYEYYANIKQ